MKILIVYYSQTGNTQKIARAIRDGMREEGHAVTLKFLKKVAYDELEAYDMVGLGSPVWYEMPPNVRRFVEEMPPQAGKLAFSFCTHGTMPDLYFPLAVPRLMNKGFRVVDWRDWYGPDAADLEGAKDWGRKVCQRAERVRGGEMDLLPQAPAPNMTPMHANAAIDHLGGFHNVHDRLVRDPEKCLYPKCHICMDNCTMGYIDLAAQPQRYGSRGDACDDCHGCTYCELLCPTGAIHPAVPYEEAAPVGQEHGSALFETVLSRAEEEGKFRRLIPAAEVGTKTPYYSRHPRHPRRKQLSFEDD